MDIIISIYSFTIIYQSPCLLIIGAVISFFGDLILLISRPKLVMNTRIMILSSFISR